MKIKEVNKNYKVKIFVSTSDIAIDNPPYKKDFLSLTNDAAMFDKWINEPKVISRFGLNALELFRKGPYFYFNGPSSDASLIADSSGLGFNIPMLTEIISIYLTNFFFGLWLVKDNSCNIEDVMVHNGDFNLFQERRRIDNNSNSQGTNSMVHFTHQELNHGDILFNRFANLFSDSMRLRQEELKEVAYGDYINHSVINNIRYKNHNRFARAILFLQMARFKSFLPMKITFYIMCLEALFTTDNDKVRQKIRKRCSYFVGGDVKHIDKSIDDGYEVRSNYAHGLRMSKFDIDKLRHVSTNVDDVIRKVIIRIIDMESHDREMFLDEDNVLAAKKFDELVPIEERKWKPYITESC